MSDEYKPLPAWIAFVWCVGMMIFMLLVAALFSNCGPIPGPKPITFPVTVTVTDLASSPLAGASVWNQQAVDQKLLTDASGVAVVPNVDRQSGVCAELAGYHSPGLPTQAETCKPAAPSVALVLEPNHVDPPPVTARKGLVRLAGAHGLQDDDGLHYFGGATMFWATWACTHDRGKLDRNLDKLIQYHTDYIRLIAHVIQPPEFWGARATDATAVNFVPTFGACLDHLYAKGVRAEVTIFGDVSDTPATRSQIVDKVIQTISSRPQTVQDVEIVNEYYAIHFPLAEAKTYAARVKSKLRNIVFVSSPNGEACSEQSNVGNGFSGVEPHFSRSWHGTKGAWTPTTQPWMGDGRFCSGGPLIGSGEPIGPGSSVQADTDPFRLAMQVGTGGVAGLAMDVFHTGTGVRGMADPSRGIPADFSSIPNIDGILSAVRDMRALLNQFPGLSGWTRGSSTDGPYTIVQLPNDGAGVKGTVDRVYCSWVGDQSLCMALDVRATTTFTAKKAMHVSIRSGVSAMTELRAVSLNAGQSFTLGSSTPGAVLVGSAR